MYSLGGFPGVLPQGVISDINDHHIVSGELYDVNSFDRLDGLEGYDEETHTGMYLRENKEVHIEGTRQQAWVYIWNRGPIGEERLIKDGVWR
jgi:gamma-glutamylcyclotransferase (GGCT)/AIG2-like uncharacterized protein YtfP